jgi:hypothetical protein
MIEIVGIFATDMAEREIGEALGEIERQNCGSHRGASRHCEQPPNQVPSALSLAPEFALTPS